MVSFTCDYNEGAHPLILKRLAETNLVQEAGYGYDSFSESAREKIRAAVKAPSADVFFISGGTQTNATVIDALLKGYEGVIAVHSGHIAVHEAGAIEFSGHKVLELPAHDGKMDAAELEDYLAAFYADPAWEHMVIPGMVYLSFPTEYGTIYTKKELSEIQGICLKYRLKLYIDGARLGYGLASEGCDLSLEDFPKLCDAFYIGGTKVGALCGEAVVFPDKAPEHFFTTVKQHGALLAKGRLTGIQFDTLFTDNLYLEISRNAIERALEVKKLFTEKGIPLYIDSPTNQQFPVLENGQMEKLAEKAAFTFWEKKDENHTVVRFAASWSTTEEDMQALEEALEEL